MKILSNSFNSLVAIRDHRRAMVKDELSVGDIYNDGEYSGRVTSISGDEITLESQSEDGDVVEVTFTKDDVNDSKQPSKVQISRIRDNASRFITKKNENDLFDYGETTIKHPNSYTWQDIQTAVEEFLESLATPGEVVPEVEAQVLSPIETFITLK